MEIDKRTGLLRGVRYVASPNCDTRPDVEDIQLVVIHGISLPPGRFGGSYIEQLFTNKLEINDHPYFHEVKNLKVSAHIVIRREGDIIQFVPFSARAWHAGESEYKGRNNCNNFSIGIELEGVDDIPYSELQYDSLATVINSLLKTYQNLSSKQITGHSNISPHRKTDPGEAFDWEYLYKKLKCSHKLLN